MKVKKRKLFCIEKKNENEKQKNCTLSFSSLFSFSLSLSLSLSFLPPSITLSHILLPYTSGVACRVAQSVMSPTWQLGGLVTANTTASAQSSAVSASIPS